MTNLLLKLLNLPATDASHIARTSVAFHGLHPLYILLFALLLAALTIFLYRRVAEDLSPFRRYTLATLRFLFLTLILVLLLRPVLTLTLESSVRRTLLILFDTSASMSDIKDRRSDDDDLKRAALAQNLLDPTKGLSQSLPSDTSKLTQLSRLDLVKAAWKNPTLNLLPTLAKDYDLAPFTFDRTLTEIAAQPLAPSPGTPGEGRGEGNSSFIIPPSSFAFLDSLSATAPSTALGDSLRSVISRKRGQPLAGILLITDGANNAGLQPLDAASLAAQDRVPLYIHGVGITRPKDIILSTIFAPEVAFAKDEVPLTIRLRSLGMTGQSAKLVVALTPLPSPGGATGSSPGRKPGVDTDPQNQAPEGRHNDSPLPSEILEKTEHEVTFSADTEQLVTVKLTPKTPGQFQIHASIAPRDDEVVKDNNASTQSIRVIDSKIKVLLVEQYPRWEFKYLQAILLRDRRVDLKCILFDGDPNLADSPASPYLRDLPRRNEDLYKFDVIILGDIDPKNLPQAQISALHDFVSKFGGSLIMLAGKRSNPNAYRKTPLETMLPVELESLLDSTTTPPANRPIRLELTPSGKSNLMLRLAERELDSVARWNQLPPIYWANKVARAKPAADVLLVDPDPAKASRYGKMPVLANHQFGLGQVLYVGTDNFWRFRKNVADTHHAVLWGQIVQRMALPRLLGASKRTQLTSDQRNYSIGDKITLFARLYTEAFEPMTAPTVKALYTASPNTTPSEVLLRPLPDRPGMYRGELIASQPGNVELVVEHDRSTKLEFTITDPKLEFTETAMNQSLLEQMASRSGGAFFREEDLHTLPEKIGSQTERLTSTLHVELWSSPLYFLLLLLTVSAEWILRKLSQLK